MSFKHSFLAVLLALAVTLGSPGLTEAQAQQACFTVKQCNEQPALTSLITQKITYTIGRRLVGSGFIHGPNLRVYVSRKDSSKHPKTYVDSDCAGAAALGITGTMEPAFAIRLYRPDKPMFSHCQTPAQVGDPPPGYDGAAYRRGIRVRRFKTLHTGWKEVSMLVDAIDDCRRRHIRVPWAHLASLDAEATRRISLKYRTNGKKSVRVIKEVVLRRDWVVEIIYGNGARAICSDPPVPAT